jgi:hypothetical protein
VRVYKNKHSGRYFIFIEDLNNRKVLLVTPRNEIKALERSLFAEGVEIVRNVLHSSQLVTMKQVIAYEAYHRDRKRESDEKKKSLSEKRFSRKLDSMAQHVSGKRWASCRIIPDQEENVMRHIDIDDEVFDYIRSKAIPYEEKTPNDTLRRLFGLKRKNKKITTTKIGVQPPSSKKPKADLQELVQSGLLEEGQKLILNYKEKKLSRKYEAIVSGKHLLWNGETCTMSRLVKIILRREGHAIPSEAYRGPDYWYNSDGRSIKDLWEQYLNEFIKEDTMSSDDITIDELRSKIETMKGEERKCAQDLMSKLEIDISKDDPGLTDTRVREFELEGKTYKADYYRGVLLKVAEIVLRKYPDEHDKILLIRGTKRKYFSKDPKDLYDYKKINGTNIYAELNENARTLRKRCEQILLQYGIDICSFKIFSYR